MVTELIFWLCLGVLVWETFLFPAFLRLFARLRFSETVTSDITPSVSFVIAAHNEAPRIARKLDNTLQLEYPKELLEIVVADDGSTDNTAEVAQSYAGHNVRLIRQQEWHGKTAAQNLAVSQACGEIVFFSDVTALYNPGAVKAMVRRFADPKVGCVTGQVKLGSAAFENKSDGVVALGLKERLHYEQEIRQAQGHAISLFGASGAIYAVRRSSYQPLAPDQVSDLVLPLQLLEQGFRTVYEPEAIATLDRPVDAAGELQRRSRIVLQCLRAVAAKKRILLPWTAGPLISVIAWYRVLRWLLPVFLITLFVSNLAMLFSANKLYFGIFLVQLAFYSVALLGHALCVKSRLVSLPFLFVWLNVAAAMAIFRLAKGEKGMTWKPVREE